MKVLVVGGGGREHALCWALGRSDSVDEVIASPGNPGIGRCARLEGVPVSDIDGMVALARGDGVDLVVVGPEAPLVSGMADALTAQGIPVFGPSAAAAQLEGSKVFAKRVMTAAGVPTACALEFTDANEALDYVRGAQRPLVVKADGLAAGKGVIVCDDAAEAEAAVDRIMTSRDFGAAGDRVLIEDRLSGQEASILAFCDGRTVVPMIAAQDHKPIGEGDTGPNTGGMGAYAPAPLVTPEMFDRAADEVLRPTVAAMAEAGTPYVGVLYAGLMIDGDEMNVLEFNCRFGDPETQAVLPLFSGDLARVMLSCCRGELDPALVAWKAGAAVCVVLASGGYPGSYEKGKAITGIDAAEAMEGVTVFHAGTAVSGGGLVTAGGRVLGVTAVRGSVSDAIEASYEAADLIRFDGAYCRRDIGRKALAVGGGK